MNITSSMRTMDQTAKPFFFVLGKVSVLYFQKKNLLMLSLNSSVVAVIPASSTQTPLFRSQSRKSTRQLWVQWNYIERISDYYLPDSIDCNSCPDSEDEEFVLDDEELSEDTQPSSPVDDSSLSTVRKEMVKFKANQISKESNEYENILKIDALINKDEVKPKGN